MAGLLARGSVQLAAFPTCRLRTEISGIGQALAAYSCGGSRGLVSSTQWCSMRTTFPHRSLVRERPSGCSTTSRCRVVNGNVAAGPLIGRRASRALLSLPAVCITLNALSGARTNCMGWRVKRESGASAHSAFNSGTAPATVSEYRRISWSLRRWRGKTFRQPKAFASPETGLTSSSG